MSKKGLRVSAGLFFAWIGVGLGLSMVAVAVWSIEQFENVRPAMLEERRYAQNFLDILEERKKTSIQEVELAVFTRHLRSFREKASAPTITEAMFYYSDVYGSRNNWGDEWNPLQRKVYLMLTMEGIGWNTFADLLPYIENDAFARMVKEKKYRERIRQVVLGKDVPPLTVDTNLPSWWPGFLILLFSCQFASAVSYMIGNAIYLAEHEEGVRWYLLSWKSVWPIFTLPLWFPGALPLIVVRGVVGFVLSVGRRRRSRTEFDSSVSLGRGHAVRDEERLLKRLQERVGRAP